MGEYHGPQMLIDMVFLAHAIVGAPKILTQLTPTVKEQLVAMDFAADLEWTGFTGRSCYKVAGL